MHVHRGTEVIGGSSRQGVIEARPIFVIDAPRSMGRLSLQGTCQRTCAGSEILSA
jgi:hypothetical protein